MEGYTYKYPHPSVTADCVIFGFDGKELKVLLIERGCEPFKGCWAFPGGFMNINETIEQCALRELKEETSLSPVSIEQFHTFSEVNRDPRERVITVAFYALVKQSEVVGGEDAAKAQLFPIKDVPRLAFDHDYILRVAQQILKEKIHFEPIGFELMDEEFSLPELQRLYEAILEVKFDRRNFEKKMIQLGILDQVESGNTEPVRNSSQTLARMNIDELFETKHPKYQFVAKKVPLHHINDNHTSIHKRGKNRKFRFNKTKYDNMKKEGIFKIEF